MGISNFYRRSFGELPAELKVAPREVLMEKAKIVGLESVDPTGNYDRMGLAKRVALELDRDEAIDDIDGVIIFQEGKGVIITTNSIPPMDKLRLIEKIREVPGVESYSRIKIFEKIEDADLATPDGDAIFQTAKEVMIRSDDFLLRNHLKLEKKISKLLSAQNTGVKKTSIISNNLRYIILKECICPGPPDCSC